jgi:hypothetical protein
MQCIADVLALLTEQHRHIEQLVARVRDGDDTRLMVDYVTAHLAVEQELLYPRIARHLAEDIRTELAAEHAEIRRVLADLLWHDREDARFGTALDRLDLLLTGHCGWQDEVLCERLAVAMPAPVRADLGLTMQGELAALLGPSIHAA